MKKKIKIDSKTIQKMSIFFNFKSEFSIKKTKLLCKNFPDSLRKQVGYFYFTFQTGNLVKKFLI